MALPFIAQAGISALINALASRIGAGAAHGGAKNLQDYLMRLFSPEGIASDTSTLAAGLRRDPSYAANKSLAMSNSASLAGLFKTNFARAGLDTSGIAQIATPLAGTSFVSNFANIDMDLLKQALSAVMQSRGQRNPLLAGTMAPSIGAGTAGGMIEGMLPILQQYLKSSGLFGTPGPKEINWGDKFKNWPGGV